MCEKTRDSAAAHIEASHLHQRVDLVDEDGAGRVVPRELKQHLPRDVAVWHATRGVLRESNRSVRRAFRRLRSVRGAWRDRGAAEREREIKKCFQKCVVPEGGGTRMNSAWRRRQNAPWHTNDVAHKKASGTEKCRKVQKSVEKCRKVQKRSAQRVCKKHAVPASWPVRSASCRLRGCNSNSTCRRVVASCASGESTWHVQRATGKSVDQRRGVQKCPKVSIKC